MQYRGFCGGSYTSQSLLADAEMTMNWYPEQIESPYGKARMVMYPTPGFSNFATTSTLGGRAMATMNGRTFAIMGGSFGEVFSTQSFTPYGSVNQDSNPGQIVFNGAIGNQALVVSGGSAYSVNLTTNTLSPVTVGAAPAATQAGMLDGFGVVFDGTTGRIWVSNINDFTTWNATQFLARTDAPDSWKAMIVVPPDIWLIGSLSGCILYDAGTFPFPFALRTGLNFKYGIVAPFSLASSGYSVMWLSQNQDGAGIVVRTRGYAPQRVSTYAVETAIASYARNFTISDAEGFIYQDQGHTFYVLQFPTANATWVFDMDLNQWHQRGYWNAALNRYDAWRPRVHTFAYGQHLTVDRTTPTIATMDVNFPTELDGSAIRRLRRAPGIFQEQRQTLIRRLDVYLESGSSLQTGQGSNALVQWRTSDDGGRTWGNERQVPIGLTGQYQALVRMYGMGIPRDRINEMVVSDPLTSWRIIDAYLNADAPPSQQPRVA